MKFRVFSALIILLMVLIPLSQATDCKVVEYPDRNEIVCKGVPQDPSANKSRAELHKETENKSEQIRLIGELKLLRTDLQNIKNREQSNNESSLPKITDIKAYALNASGYVGITCVMKSNVSGNASVVIVGKNFDGVEIISVVLKGIV